MLHWLTQTHHFFRRQALYPLLLSTLLACLLFAGRAYRSESFTYIFLVWNLFLAWVPYLASLWVAYLFQHRGWRWWFLLLPAGLIWLAFLPNAPYLVTDLLHLRERPGIPIWYDLALLTIFAWTGLFLAAFSLRAMQAVVKATAGVWLSWLFVIGIVSLSGLGVYLGRFLRWNSWDLLFHPQEIGADIMVRLANPFHDPRTIGVTVIFAMFLFICYLTITTNPLHEQT